MLTNLSTTQRRTLLCVADRSCGGWLPQQTISRFVRRSHYAVERMRLYGLLYSRRQPRRGGWWKMWRLTPLGVLVVRGLKQGA